jgi:hypothetical protein
MKLITPQLKDKILNDIVSKGIIQVYDINKYANNYDLDTNELYATLKQFEEKGLLKIKPNFGDAIELNVKVNAHDFLLHGGFTAQEELLVKNLEKLLLEIESLKPSMPEKVSTLTNIAANIATAMGLFLQKFS